MTVDTFKDACIIGMPEGHLYDAGGGWRVLIRERSDIDRMVTGPGKIIRLLFLDYFTSYNNLIIIDII